MFVLMGLSAVIPVLHGVELYGINEMRGRIGLSWLVLQGFLYILGAGLYAVSLPIHLGVEKRVEADQCRLVGRNDRHRALSISGEVPTRYFMFWWSWLLRATCMGCSRRSIIIMGLVASNVRLWNR
jgi:predicted membrane channel-forming protein YqfA (hemolysin III family)